jgi:DNA-binding transcriptional regulator YhcF (GntR family)
MTVLRVDHTSPVPPYEQLRTQIAEMIDAGTLATGDRLPPIRQLAADLGIAPGTVARAYSELERAGLVTSRRPHGTTVAAGVASRPAEQRRAAVIGAAADYARRARALGIDKRTALRFAREALDGAV